jgi:hypothetical protein
MQRTDDHRAALGATPWFGPSNHIDLGGVAAGARSFDLAASCLGSGRYQVAVVAVGKAMIRDHASGWRPYTAP